jgi:amino acid transporter
MGAHSQTAPGSELSRNSVGVLGIVFFVIAAAAPLTVVVAVYPVIIAQGNGIGIAGTFVLVASVLLLFSVGFVAMSRHITNAGAFYAYVTKGLGRPMGLGSATMAIFSYNAIQLGLYGGIGYYAQQYVAERSRIDLPWWVYSFTAMLACLLLGIRRIEAGARVLAILLTLETGVIAVLDIAIIAHGGGIERFSLAPFSVDAVRAGSIGVALMFAHASFIGFEGTAIYGEEARSPKRTIPIATYVAVIFMGVFYSLTAWLMVDFLGRTQTLAIARASPANFTFVVSDRALGHLGSELFAILVVTSMFAAVVAFHNNVARYLFSLGRQGVAWRAMGRTHPRTRSPYIACYVQTAMVAAVVAVFAFLRLPPYETLFTWFTGIGAAGIIAVQCIASVAILAFFRRTAIDRRAWNTFIAPLLGSIGLFAFMYFALTSLDVLIGASGLVEQLFLVMLVASFGIGLLAAYALQRWQPARYRQLESFLGDRIPAPAPGP